MAMSVAATMSLHRLTAVLFGMALTISFAAAEEPTKGADSIRVVNGQMHQLQVVKVEAYPFRAREIGDRSDSLQ